MSSSVVLRLVKPSKINVLNNISLTNKGNIRSYQQFLLIKKDLTASTSDRQNILNNKIAIDNIQENIGISGMVFKGEYSFTKSQFCDFYSVDISTIERYLSSNEEELKHNGYENLKGKSLKEFKEEFGWMLLQGSKAPQLGVFNFRAFLNLGMLLTESEKAKALRSVVLDIVIDT